MNWHSLHYDEISSKLKNLNEEEIISNIKSAGWLIKYINNPSDKVKLISVKQNCYSIQWIKNPSEKLQIIAINNIAHNMTINGWFDDLFVTNHITSEKALELYNKLKKVKGIIQ